MSKIHLHLVQCTFTRINNCLEEIALVYQKNDIIILLEDAVFAVHLPISEKFDQLYLLEDDQYLSQNTLSTVKSIQFINYMQMAQLITQADKVLNWR